MQIKQVDCEMSGSSWYFWKTAHTRVESHEKANSEASAKLKEVKRKPSKINEWGGDGGRGLFEIRRPR